MGKYICQRPIHPGELLKEETEERKLSQRKLAEQMGISYTDGHLLQGAERHPQLPPAGYDTDSHAIRSCVGNQCLAADADAARL